MAETGLAIRRICYKEKNDEEKTTGIYFLYIYRFN